MTLSAKILAKIFEELAEHKSKRALRRLYKESGPAGRKAWLYSTRDTKKILESFPKGADAYDISIRTFVMVLDNLKQNKCEQLIKLVLNHGGGDAKKALQFSVVSSHHTGKSP